ncbi:MAG TPA: DNA topoisomerase VI subunit B [Phycisphaerae bacterium]|nr:DNA topoisomerase VI subunit B [Phycisphaerae bacterium]
MATDAASLKTGHTNETQQMLIPFPTMGRGVDKTVPPEPPIPEAPGTSMKKKPTRKVAKPAKAGRGPAKKARRIKPEKKAGPGPKVEAQPTAGAPKEAAPPRRKSGRGYATAESMGKAQREISVSEFFAKNRHLLGFDNKRKALLTTVKEAVDNSLDACEEAGILPDIYVKITQSDTERFCVTVRDNGPGIVKHQIPNIFGKLLYGSKFHRLKMSRGQQGIGISAAGMYGLLTTGKSIRITSRIGKRSPAHYYEVQINTKTNAPQSVKDDTVDVEWEHGTEVSIELVASYQKGRASVDEYLELTAIANPHAYIQYVDPAGEAREFVRAVSKVPEPTAEIKPHPYGIELGVLIKMLKDERAKTLAQFLHGEFSRVSSAVAGSICETAKLSPRARPTRIGTHEAETLYKALQETKIRPPATDCLSPIGPQQVLAGLLKGVKAEFFAANTRSPTVYRGNPFQIEVGLAYGGELGPAPEEVEEDNNGNEAVVRRGKVVQEKRSVPQARLMRFANRVPLLHQLSGCCIYKAVAEVDWRRYGLSQPGGSLPYGPLAIFVHLASVWVPFTSEGKEAIADYDEIRKEIKLAVQDCARKLQAYLNRRKRQKYESGRRDVFTRYIGEVVNACGAITRINKHDLHEDLLAIAKRVTARADEELGQDGKPLAASTDSEYGENTIVVDREARGSGPLFEQTTTVGKR